MKDFNWFKFFLYLISALTAVLVIKWVISFVWSLVLFSIGLALMGASVYGIFWLRNGLSR